VTKSRGRPQIERGLVIMSPAVAEEQARWSPDPEQVTDWDYVQEIPGVGRIAGRHGLDKENDRLLEFALTAQVEHGGGWANVARIDTAHGSVHMHIFNQRGDKIALEELRPVYGPEDVSRGYDEAEHKLIAEWEENLRRWRRGR
jgi:hypothetical protein